MQLLIEAEDYKVAVAPAKIKCEASSDVKTGVKTQPGDNDNDNDAKAKMMKCEVSEEDLSGLMKGKFLSHYVCLLC